MVTPSLRDFKYPTLARSVVGVDRLVRLAAALWFATSLVVTAPTSVMGQSTTFRDGTSRADDSVNVVLTISGAISQGSYQAGVNWALLEMFKLTEGAENRRRWNLPRYDLAAMAGASAGSINGFITAVEWCTSRQPLAANRSLFWHVWLGTGYDQLRPPDRSEQDPARAGVLSRQYIEEVLLDSLANRMLTDPRADAPRDCRVPVGVTITRLTPGRIAISEELSAPTQRYASVVEVGRRTAADRVTFLRPRTELRDTRQLGALIPLIPNTDGTIPSRRVFDLILASSAVPGAFSPVALDWIEDPACPASTECTISDAFVDGGLFDNNPIDLAVGLYREGVWRDSRQSDPSALLVFISPNQLRGRYAEAKQQQAKDPRSEGGIGALLELFGGAIPSARQYELHAFARLLEHAPETFVRENIKVVSRAFPIVGEQFGDFAAFLGKPFREFDFYVGVYDALTFLARQACPPRDDDCIGRRLKTLLDDAPLQSDADDRTGAGTLPAELLGALYQWEYEDGEADLHLPDVNATDARHQVTAGLLRANGRLALGFDNEQCHDGDAIKNLMCRNGFRSILTQLQDAPTLRSVDQSLRQTGAARCSAQQWRTSSSDCDVDQTFHRLLRHPERFMADATARLLHEIWRIERARKNQSLSNYAGFATIGEILHHSTLGYRYRRGVEFNTSSVPTWFHGAWLTQLVPNYASFNVGSRGIEFGYRPTWQLSNTFAAGVTLAPLHLNTGASAAIDKHRWVVGPTIRWKRTDVLISGVELGLEMFGSWHERPFTSGADQVLAVPLNVHFLADKVRLGVRYIPNNTTAINNGSEWSVSVGFTDLNGLLYWGLRRLGAV